MVKHHLANKDLFVKTVRNPINMDILTYTYQDGNNNSNRLMKVTDAASVGASQGFNNGNSGTSNDYTYDGNGNMLSDLNKNITSISYNFLNLPEAITFGNGSSIEYIYNAAGVKVMKTVNNINPPNVYTDYLDGFQYVGGMLNFFPTAEGYVRATSQTEDPADPQLLFNYVYNYTDHLGNIRLSYTKDLVSNELEILDESHYYPFGLKHNSYDSSILQDLKKEEEENGNVARPGLVIESPYNYKYNGKELQDELGLGWYDYQARNYDPALGRWMNIDPLAEVSRKFSPYAYALNNPIFFIDPDGMMAEPPGDFIDEDGKKIGSDGKSDGKVYVVKTTKKKFGPKESKVSGANLSGKDKNAAIKFVKENDGNSEAFDGNSSIYDSFVEIEGNTETRQGMVDSVSGDDGTGGTTDSNNREYGCMVCNDGSVENVEPGSVINPLVDKKGHISFDLKPDTKSTVHSHPSGTNSITNDDGSITVGSGVPSPSPKDISSAGRMTNYVIGKGNGTVYIYNKNGVQATIPLKNFVNFK